ALALRQFTRLAREAGGRLQWSMTCRPSNLVSTIIQLGDVRDADHPVIVADDERSRLDRPDQRAFARFIFISMAGRACLSSGGREPLKWALCPGPSFQRRPPRPPGGGTSPRRRPAPRRSAPRTSAA